MGGKARLDYSKIDPWIKKNPKANFEDFVKVNPKVAISSWTFRKQRARLLGLTMPPSMRSDYRGGKGGSTEGRRSSSVYTTVYSTPIQELKKKDGVAAVSEFIGIINRMFKLHLESAQIEMFGSGVPKFEIRRYSR
jgi:hypothetical protein